MRSFSARNEIKIMKILHILNTIEFSGAEIMLKGVAPILINNGFELHALSTGDEVGPYADILRNCNYKIHHIPFKKSPKYFIKFYNLIREEKYDVVHIHPERAFFWHALVAKQAGVKNPIRTVHSVFNFSGYLRIKRMIQRFVASKVLGVQFMSIGYSVSETEKNIFFNNTILIPNWINQRNFLPPKDENERNQMRIKLGISRTDRVIVSVGSCTDVKNHNDIIIALAELIKKTKNIFYIHVGDGPLQKKEKKLAVKLGVFDRIKFLGQIENVRDTLISSDILVMPSKYEGFGISCLEAASCGIPSVVYNVEGLRDIVKNGENGILVEPNPNAIALAVEELIRNEKLRKHMGIKSRERLLRYFNMQDSLDKLIKIYRGVRVV